MNGRVFVVCLVLAMISICEMLAIESTDEKPFCKDNKCGKFGYRKIQRKYPGIFYTEKQMHSKERKFDVMREKYLSEQGVVLNPDMPGDGDSCCPTEVLSLTNTTLVNLNGETKFIIHTPPKYQYIPHGFCVKGGTCDGSCVIEYLTQTLLTFNPVKSKLEFDQFVFTRLLFL